MPKIILESLTEPEKTWKVNQFPFKIGRMKDNQLVIAETYISREHAEIRKVGEGYSIADLESRNGTFVNGERIQEVSLKSGDKLNLGGYELRFKVEDSETPSGPKTEQIKVSQTAPIETRK